MPLDVLTLGRVSVDLYGREPHTSFREPQTFLKSIGGSPTNVAVAAARLGLRSALVTRVGDDALGAYAVGALQDFGVQTDFVGVEKGGSTPVVLIALDDPAEPTIIFYRTPEAPDTLIDVDAVDDTVLAAVAVVWLSASALSTGPTARTALHWLARRNRGAHTVLDLDLRPSFWPSPAAATAAADRAIAGSTVVIGNRVECEMAVGATDPDDAADALLDRGVTLAVVKMGADGVLLASTQERLVVDPIPVEVRCGLGAGDAFGGALTAGLVHGWPLERVGRTANAAGALVATRLTCSHAMPTLPELEEFAAQHEAARPYGVAHG